MADGKSDAMSSTSERCDKPLFELLSHSMADIYVGPDSQHWIIHEKLLCHYSPVLRQQFYRKGSRSSTYGLPDESEEAFRLFVGWLYSGTLHFPLDESELGTLLDVYLLAARLEVAALEADVVDTVRAFYQHTASYPGLRRVQYVYANTVHDNPMREMLVGAVARQLTLAEHIPPWWAKALRNNGELAVDIIRAIQEWHLESRSVPDVREGREPGFSSIDEAKSMEGEPSEHGDGEVTEEGSSADQTKVEKDDQQEEEEQVAEVGRQQRQMNGNSVKNEGNVDLNAELAQTA